MDHGLGNLQTFLECFQFYLAPTDVHGNNPDTSKRPHVIANSYGCGSGTCKLELFVPAIKALKIAGVATIASAGNSGRCSNINNVPAMIEDVIAVGSTDFQTNTISKFSDKGPVTGDRSNRLKPDFTAPGARIYSAIHCCGDYRENSGTSMACPHIGASIALLWSGVPKLKRNIDETIRILKLSTIKQESTDCKSPQRFPNYVYGYGTPDLRRAYEIAIAKYGKE
jgi:serine protease AprX